MIVDRRGPRVRVCRTIDIGPTTQVAGEVIAEQRRILAETGHVPTAQVDTVGVGGGVADMLREAGSLVIDMVAGAAAQEPKRFANARAEWYWQLRDLFEAGQIDLDPRDDELAAQLANLRWELTGKGLIKIESKDDMAARGVSSPDLADALMLAVGTPPTRRTGSGFYNFG